MSIFNKSNKSNIATDSVKNESLYVAVNSLNTYINGVSKTNGISPIGLIGRSGKKEKPGFTPNELYDGGSLVINDNRKAGYSNNIWFGVLLQNHPDYSSDLPNRKQMNTNDRFNESILDGYSSTRDYFLGFNDPSTDYFKHGLQIIDNLGQIRTDKNLRETWDGSEEGTPQRLSQFKNSPYENNDPVIFGFEIIIDSVSSPLLNGSVEDFINQFSKISEVAVRKHVIYDFKQQFEKIFKTNAKILSQSTNRDTISIKTTNYANTDNQSSSYSSGRRSYLSYYLKKVAGLEMLIESNSSAKKKYLVDYRNDNIKLTFSEDISLSLGTLAHLYKLLYWSKPNGKNIIPENLLRFNCDIIISELRNITRVRKGVESGSLEVIKENLSRYIYSLKECQFWFDQPAHESEIDLSSPTKDFDQFLVSIDYKYVTSKFERWTPDLNTFGKYVGYDNGAIWKIGNQGAREVQSANGTVVDKSDISNPRFYTSGGNKLNQNGVISPKIFENYTFTNIKKEEENAMVSTINSIKKTSQSAATLLSKNLKKAAIKEVKSQINIRLKLLNDTLDKVRNATALGRMNEPSNVYKVPYYYNSLSNKGISNNFFFDVHNSLRDFAGQSIGNAIGGKLGDKLGGMIKGSD